MSRDGAREAGLETRVRAGRCGQVPARGLGLCAAAWGRALAMAMGTGSGVAIALVGRWELEGCAPALPGDQDVSPLLRGGN